MGRPEFAWKQAQAFTRLEREFARIRREGCNALEKGTDSELGDLLALIANKNRSADDPFWELLERAFFAEGVRAAACPQKMDEFAKHVAHLLHGLGEHASDWDLSDADTLGRLYRLRYGTRAAYEEALLQANNPDLALFRNDESELRVPTIELHGVRLQSGDLLVSRGGAPTSALISRGNDRPGNFSHVALLHIDDKGRPSVIESHIESGVGVFSVEKYLRDKKLRIMVLRLQRSHPLLATAPDLPHRAAEVALKQATIAPADYDFSMDYRDPSQMFCSEVAYHAYRSQGVSLWKALSSLSGPAAGRWLAGLGVEHFETLAPSDLEYDPQLRVVAEWRDPGALLADHVDNAIVDALLERARGGAMLEVEPLRVGPARLAKGYSFMLNLFGHEGPIPKGMSAASALRVERLRALFETLRDSVHRDVEGYRKAEGHLPPYWTILEFAERHTEPLF